MIEDNGYRHEDISRVVPIGGPSKMPIVRHMLEHELGISVEQGLDPMTAVAAGAAIFAESREWGGTRSSQKAARATETVTGSINLSYDYKSRVLEESARLRIKPEGELPEGFEVEVIDEQEATTGKKRIEGPVSLALSVPRSGENRYRVRITNLHGIEVAEASRELVIFRTEATAASIPMTYTLAVKTQTGTVGLSR